ncbi:carboxylic acid reductase [Embleya hyalina]|uniref:Putative fatty-acid-CoA ligase FadD n=1 Tax=Embleya hyalina TaxID=516124 RepID=A0A401YDY7_9ACTN|nr:carboxylic acid reductase [Embleya hyalina]GCD92798.1 putative fatty-acid-CoA ligase FadD [Embleya hyalina]
MSSSSATCDREIREDRGAAVPGFPKPADVVAEDAQLRAAVPLDSVGAAFRDSADSLVRSVGLLMDAYARRPALGRRATHTVIDPASGRTTLEALPRFDTITYAELWERAGAVAAEWTRDAAHTVGAGDFVAVYGFVGLEYTVLDLACLRSGAVSVPLPSSAPVARLRSIVDEVGPRILAVGVEVLDSAVELVLSSTSRPRLVVFDHHPEVDDQRERFEAARRRLAEAGCTGIDALTAVTERGRTLPPAAPVRRPTAADAETMRLLVYTSGSTGEPKGAIYTERMLRRLWMGSIPADDGLPWITVQYLPLSHVAGRTALFHTLGHGGTAYFTAKSDVSTLFDDIRLVRPTQLMLVPRICDTLHREHRNEPPRQEGELAGEPRLGGRVLRVMCGSAPLSPELARFMESYLGRTVHDSYGSTEAGVVLFDSLVQRPAVSEYKLVDVPESGYRTGDLPHPRGELLIKSEFVTPGYHGRPETTAEVFDEDGFYRTGDIMREIGPDRLVYVGRRNDMLKLAQGEFVAVSRLEGILATAPLVRQVYVYGNGERAHLLAVIVPTEEAMARAEGDELKRALGESLQRVARQAELERYEIPRDFLVETEPFDTGNGLLSELRKNVRPRLRERYGDRLERLYEQTSTGRPDELRALREAGADQPVLAAIRRAAGAFLGLSVADPGPAARFTDLGIDSLSALAFAELLRDVFGVEVPVGMLLGPGCSLRAIAEHIEAVREFGEARPSAATVHGAGGEVVRAVDLTPDRFIDAATLNAARSPATAVRPTATGTVLLTGANGYLGRFVCLDLLERLADTGGRLVCVVRGRDDAEARRRLDAAFDGGGGELPRRYRELATHRLDVLAGDIGRERLGLDAGTWRRLTEDVDRVFHLAALVNHVLPYDRLFGPNVVGTAELIKLALTGRIKPFTYLSSVGVAAGVEPARLDESADIREASPERRLSDAYATGYATSKWAGEVLLRGTHELCGLPVTVLRSDMILAHPRHAGQLNVTDVFTRLMLSLVATGIAPASFYRRDVGAQRPRAHYDGLPVDFVARVVDILGAHDGDGFRTYNVVNPHDDGISLDTFVDWLVAAGHGIDRVDDHGVWFTRFEAALRALPKTRRRHSVLPLLHVFRQPAEPVAGSTLPAGRFARAVRAAGIGESEIPHLSAGLIDKYAADLRRLGLI